MAHHQMLQQQQQQQQHQQHLQQQQQQQQQHQQQAFLQNKKQIENQYDRSMPHRSKSPFIGVMGPGRLGSTGSMHSPPVSSVHPPTVFYNSLFLTLAKHNITLQLTFYPLLINFCFNVLISCH